MWLKRKYMHKNPTARWETRPGVIFLTSTTSSPHSAEGPHDDRKKWNRNVRQRVGKKKVNLSRVTEDLALELLNEYISVL